MSRLNYLRLAQGTLLFVSAGSAAGNLMITTFIVPRLLEAPTPTMLAQWRKTFYQGMSVFKTTFQLTAAGFFGLAYQAGIKTKQGKMLAVGGALTVGIIPYTLAFMMPTNRELLVLTEKVVDEKSGELSTQKVDHARKLVDDWGVLNAGRSALATTAGILGFAAVFM